MFIGRGILEYSLTVSLQWYSELYRIFEICEQRLKYYVQTCTLKLLLLYLIAFQRFCTENYYLKLQNT